MSKDLTSLLTDWPNDDQAVVARVIRGNDGQPFVQLRLNCGLLQMSLDGRPDGTRPQNCSTFLEYLERRLDLTPGSRAKVDEVFESPESVWAELDREITQFYHRRLALLAVAREAHQANQLEAAKSYYERAVRDAEYTLRAMNFIREHCGDEEHVDVHERFRPFVLWHRTIALTQKRIIENDIDDAIEQIKCCKDEIAKVYNDHGLKKWLKYDPSMAELRDLEQEIRSRYGIKATLREQLDRAVQAEDYERAARIRDQLKARGRFRYASSPVVPGAPKI